MEKLRNFGIFFAGFLSTLLVLWGLAAFTQIPGLSDLRNLWIETAMTTGDHQWLAEMVFPKFVIVNVMDKQINPNVMNDIDLVNPDAVHTLQPGTEGELDEQGNLIVVDDKEQEIRIVKITGSGFVGHMLFVADASRVVVQTTDKPGIRGQFISNLCEAADGIAAINANGFADTEGHGSGGQIIAWTVSEGKEWGRGSKSEYISMGFDEDDRLVVGNLKNFEDYNIRDLVQYQPALIIDGKQVISYKRDGSAGWGLQPRTVVGQTSEGTVILVVVDGRQPGYSLGITMGEISDILFSYGVVNAAACDGGSSSIMYYDDHFMGVPSTPMKDTGRYLPNAIVVKRKEVDD
jgi:exopolysaccharide biosynthesis protein